MYQSEIKQNNKEAILELKGTLNIQSIQQIQEVMLGILPFVDHLFINHDEAEEFDLSYLQVLVALNKTSENCGKRIEFSYPELFKAILHNSGYSSIKLFSGGN